MTPVELAQQILKLCKNYDPLTICKACLHVIQLIEYTHSKEHSTKVVSDTRSSS